MRGKGEDLQAYVKGPKKTKERISTLFPSFHPSLSGPNPASTHLSPLRMHLLNRLHRPQMIHARIDPYLIEHHYACLPRLLIQVLHRLRDVRGGDDVGFSSDS